MDVLFHYSYVIYNKLAETGIQIVSHHLKKLLKTEKLLNLTIFR